MENIKQNKVKTKEKDDKETKRGEEIRRKKKYNNVGLINHVPPVPKRGRTFIIPPNESEMYCIKSQNSIILIL